MVGVPPSSSLSVILLTYNCGKTLDRTLDPLADLGARVFAVDSYSNDCTVALLRSRGVWVTQRSFAGYGDQRNWAMANLPLKSEWLLHLDADEVISHDLAREILSLRLNQERSEQGFFIPRQLVFGGKRLRHGGIFPTWHMRLFRRGKGRCEERLYDQHFIVEGPTGALKGLVYDDNRMPLREWVARHRRWARLEAQELSQAKKEGRIHPSWSGNPIQRKRAQKALYEKAPPLVRPFLLFGYRYVLRLGFLDGWQGLLFHFLQSFCFRMLVDIHLIRIRLARLWGGRVHQGEGGNSGG